MKKSRKKISTPDVSADKSIADKQLASSDMDTEEDATVALDDVDGKEKRIPAKKPVPWGWYVQMLFLTLFSLPLMMLPWKYVLDLAVVCMLASGVCVLAYCCSPLEEMKISSKVLVVFALFVFVPFVIAITLSIPLNIFFVCFISFLWFWFVIAMFL